MISLTQRSLHQTDKIVHISFAVLYVDHEKAIMSMNCSGCGSLIIAKHDDGFQQAVVELIDYVILLFCSHKLYNKMSISQ